MMKKRVENDHVLLKRPQSADGPPASFGLSQGFGESIDWHPPQNRDEVDKRDDNVVGMLRLPELPPGIGLDNRFVACSRKTYKGTRAEIEAPTHQRFWDARLANVRPLTDGVDFLKSGSIIWEHMNLHASRARVANMLGLKAVDQHTADAVEIAMFSAFNTSADVPDMEAIAFALGSFIYACSEFKEMQRKGRFRLPFGNDTAFTLIKPHGFAFEEVAS